MRARPLAVLVALLALAALADAGLLRWRVVHGLRVSGIPITLNVRHYTRAIAPAVSLTSTDHHQRHAGTCKCCRRPGDAQRSS